MHLWLALRLLTCVLSLPLFNSPRHPQPLWTPQAIQINFCASLPPPPPTSPHHPLVCTATLLLCTTRWYINCVCCSTVLNVWSFPSFFLLLFSLSLFGAFHLFWSSSVSVCFCAGIYFVFWCRWFDLQPHLRFAYPRKNMPQLHLPFGPERKNIPFLSFWLVFLITFSLSYFFKPSQIRWTRHQRKAAATLLRQIKHRR